MQIKVQIGLGRNNENLHPFLANLPQKPRSLLELDGVPGAGGGGGGVGALGIEEDLVALGAGV